MSSKKLTLSRLAAIFGLIMITFMYACDTLEEDVNPNGQEIKIEGAQLYTLSNNATYIDLYSLVKTQERVQLKINSQPRNGALTEMGKGVLQYLPNEHFVKGKDAFGFSILTLDNKLLRQDSVIIIVVNDSTKLPCGMYTSTDFITDSIHSEVIIDVLKNDMLCDSSHVKLEVYQPTSGSLPIYGTATVVTGNKIKYVPGNNFKGTDQIIYKVSSTLDSSKFSFGHVIFSPLAFNLVNDNYIFKRDTLSTDSLKLYVFQNDFLPGLSSNGYLASITAAPHHGSALVNGMISLNYAVPSSPLLYTDSITYRVCKGAQCKTAKVYIKIN